MTETEKTYDVQEAAQILDVIPITIRKYIHEGKIQAVKTGKRYEITEKALEDYLKGVKAN